MKKLLILFAALAFTACATGTIQEPEKELSPAAMEVVRTRAIVDSLKKSPPWPPACVWKKKLKAAEEAVIAAEEALAAEQQ